MGRGFIQICDGGLTFLKFQVNSDGLTHIYIYIYIYIYILLRKITLTNFLNVFTIVYRFITSKMKS